VSSYLPEAAVSHVGAALRNAKMPAAIFAASDDLAIGATYAAVALGLQPGRDVHVVGFDGQQRGRDMMHGPLTTIAIPTEAMGLEAAQRLAQRLNDTGELTRHVQLPCRLIQGVTTQSGGSAHEV
jgi:LacI family transcriptional regulator